MTPEQERVLRALRQRDARGITQVDFDAPDVIDGQKPIKRVAARVHELIHEYGHDIGDGGRRNSCKVYVLHLEGQTAARPPAPAALPPAPLHPQGPPAASAADQPVLSLLDDAAHRGQRSAIFDDDLGSAA